MSVAVYPGSFDPITNGHLDIVERAMNVFERVIIGVLANPRKTSLLGVEERIGIIRAALAEAGIAPDRIDVTAFNGLTIDFCRAQGATAIVRGLRAISDFEVEMQLAHNNRVLAPKVDTVFFMTSVANGYVSSSLVKEIASFGGDISSMIPGSAIPAVTAALARRYGRPTRAIIDRSGAHPFVAAPPAAAPPEQEGPSHRHHLPRRASGIADRERQEAAAHDQRRPRPECRARPDR